MGAYPPMGPPSPPYPPLYMSFCQFRGDNPLYNGKINFRKNCSPTHKCGGGKSFYPYICGMETKDMIYGEIKFYSYFSREQNCVVVTDNVDEYITHSERYKMGGNMGVHLTPTNT